jgi:TonB family protein
MPAVVPKVVAKVNSQTLDQSLEPNFLLDWEAGRDRSYRRTAAIGTAAIHILLVIALILIPAEPTAQRRAVSERHITPLVDPPLVLTQKAPNPNKPSLTLSLESAPPAPKAKFNLPPPPAPQPETQPKLMAELPPKIEPAPAPVTNKTPGALNNLPQPAAPAAEQPKLALETPSAPKPAPPRLTVPDAGVQEAVKNLAHSGGSSNAVGDIVPDIFGSRSPSPGPPRAAVGLKSDPMGVDFRPYLQQVLQSVKRNWFAVMPESARLGQRGQVVLIFGVNKEGKITKIVFSTESGSQPLDRAAVAALSASDPLPRLPAEYRGATVALQFTFQYNAPAH